MKKIFKKIIAPLLAIGIGVLSPVSAAAVTTVYGSSEEVSTEASVPTLIFTNEESNSADLYVRKQVHSSVEGYQPDPEQEFRFHITVNGESYKRQTYTVTNSYGEEVIHYWDPLNLIENPFKTDRNGDFTLKDGWTAKFEGVGNGVEFVITEIDTPEGYRQVYPAGGAAAAGVVEGQGTTVTFENSHTPELEGEETELVVNKRIAYPSSYELPETEEFRFRLYVDGTEEDAEYADKSYEIYDLSSGEQIDTGRTDERGEFTLKGNQSAKFKEIPAPVDYRIEELTENMPEGWRIVGESSYEGATSPGHMEVDFTNANASFYVSKELLDHTIPENAVFEYTLLNEEKLPWEGAKYLLYEGKTILKDEKGENIVGQTEVDGTFRLKAGQTAMFYGIPTGVGYSVAEKTVAGYRQVVPENLAGYENKEVQDSVEGLPFVNESFEEKGDLTLTKLVTTGMLSSKKASSEEEFIFYLYEAEADADGNVKVDENGESIKKPLSNRIYSIRKGMNEVETYRTDQDGRLTLKANETAVFEGLPKGKTYLVEEQILKSQKGFRELTEDEDENIRKAGTLEEGTENLNLLVHNLYHYEENGLPNTGGLGTALIVILGAVVAGAGIYATTSRKKAK